MSNSNYLTKIITVILLIIIYGCVPPNVQWERLTIGNEDLHGVYFVNDNEGWVVGENSTIIHTTDRFATWDYQSSPTAGDLYDIHMYSATEGCIVGGTDINNGLVIHTNNGGGTWTISSIPSNTPILYAVDFSNTVRGCAVGGLERHGVAIKTTNGGANWNFSIDGVVPTIPPTPVDYYTPILRGISTPTAARRWTVGKTDTILRTDNSGGAWFFEGSQFMDYYDIEVVYLPAPGAYWGWAVGGKGLAHDGIVIHRPDLPPSPGLPWEIQLDGSIGPDPIPLLRGVSFVDRNNGWAVGDHDIVISTNNGGSTWNIEEAADMNEPNLNAVYFPSTIVGYAVGDDGKILRR